MRTTTVTRTILALAAITSITATSACADQGSGRTKAANGQIEEVRFHSGLRCDVFYAHGAGGVSCDFSTLAGTDVTTITPEKISVARNGNVASSVVGDHLCVSYVGAKTGGLTCYYPHAGDSTKGSHEGATS